MECNKDEATRAKEIAEKKFSAKDIAGAKKFALKAQNLYPGLEGIPQMMATLDVYVAAGNKINGEADWYGILGADPQADDEAVRKHYRKSDDTSQVEISSNCGSSEAANTGHLLCINYSESDLEAVDYVPVPTTTQLASYMSTYHKRQAFVTYLQSNPGGFSVFGWTIDRTLINTIFFLEMSLVLFVLGKTITIYHS